MQTPAFTAPMALSVRSAPPSLTHPPVTMHAGRPRPAATAASPMPRRAFLAMAAATVAVGLTRSAEAASKSAMTGDYKVDAAQVLTDMRAACDLTRGTPGMSEVVGKTRQEMNDFVALYRRNDKVSGSNSFSTLYTAINTLSGHYASYGSSYPVPEKRKKRLTQQFSDIDRALNRGR